MAVKKVEPNPQPPPPKEEPPTPKPGHVEPTKAGERRIER